MWWFESSHGLRPLQREMWWFESSHGLRLLQREPFALLKWAHFGFNESSLHSLVHIVNKGFK